MQVDPNTRPPRTPQARAWFRLAQTFAATLRGARHEPGGLLLVGTEEHEPWHLAAHLSDTAHFTGHPQLAPTLVRHHVPTGAPAHLAVDLCRLSSAARNETILVTAPTVPGPHLLERLDDARRHGALLLALDSGPSELGKLAHESLAVPALVPAVPGASALTADFDLAEHLLTVAAAKAGDRTARRGLLRRYA